MSRRKSVPLNSRRDIAALFLDPHEVLFFYDYDRDCYVYQDCLNDKIIEQKSAKMDEEGLLDIFVKRVQQLASQHIGRKSLEKKPVDLTYLPHGIAGVRTFDPSKRRKSRSLFDYYKQREKA